MDLYSRSGSGTGPLGGFHAANQAVAEVKAKLAAQPAHVVMEAARSLGVLRRLANKQDALKAVERKIVDRFGAYDRVDA